MKHKQPHNRKPAALLWIALGLLVVTWTGCNRGDFKATPVIAGSPAPHAGYNVGPDLFVNEGDPVPVTGAVIWIKGLGPKEMRAKNADLQSDRR